MVGSPGTVGTLDGVYLAVSAVRVVVEKDQAPHWRPETLAEVPASDVEAAFAPLGERDLRFE